MVLLGPPGTGKTTIAKMLQDSHKLHHISLDDIRSKLLADLVGGV